jgi:hypothetical protein
MGASENARRPTVPLSWLSPRPTVASTIIRKRVCRDRSPQRSARSAFVASIAIWS